MGASEGSLNPQNIDWQSPENHILLNSYWPAIESQSLQEVANSISKERNLHGHIWIATSGSTSESAGHIKLVALSKKAFLISAKSVNMHLRTSSADIWLQILPRFHVGGLGVEVRALLSNSQVIFDFEKWNPERVHKTLTESKVTITSMVPTQIFDLIQAKLKSPIYLRAVIVGGGLLSESLYVQGRELGWPLLPSFGMTESCSQIATASLETLQSRDLPLAQKLSHIELRLNQQGLLQIRGPSLLTCYGQRQKDGRILDWDPKEEGWLTTEDFVSLEGAHVRFVGRKNDFIKIGGESSSMGRLREIFDRVLNALNATVTQQVLLMDAPSARLGTEIHLITTLENQKDFLLQLKETFNKQVLPFERIHEVRYIRNIPRSDLGKILWKQLKKDLYGY